MARPMPCVAPVTKAVVLGRHGGNVTGYRRSAGDLGAERIEPADQLAVAGRVARGVLPRK